MRPRFQSVLEPPASGSTPCGAVNSECHRRAGSDGLPKRVDVFCLIKQSEVVENKHKADIHCGSDCHRQQRGIFCRLCLHPDDSRHRHWPMGLGRQHRRDDCSKEEALCNTKRGSVQRRRSVLGDVSQGRIEDRSPGRVVDECLSANTKRCENSRSHCIEGKLDRTLPGYSPYMVK